MKGGFAGRIESAALLAIAGGLALRLDEAGRTYLNPDDLWNMYYALPGNWTLAGFEHPPLLAWLLHEVLRINSSELAVRMIPVLAGSIFPWFVYRWLARVRNIGAGFAALLILTFSPNLVSLSAQVRGYTLAILFAALALWLVESAFEPESVLRLVLFAICLYLAILTEFSTAWFVGAAGVYVLWRGIHLRVSRRFWLVWGLSQIGASLLYVFLYRTVILPSMSQFGMEAKVSSYLRGAFPVAGENPLTFAVLATIKQFAYTLSSVPLGVIAALLFAIGLVILWRERRDVALAILVGFLLGIAGGILKLHPYGRSRQTVIFCLFIAAGAGVGIEALLRRKPWVSAVAALALIVGWPYLAEPDQHNISWRRYQLASMHAAAKQLHGLLPPGALVLTDAETSVLLRYYWCGTRKIPERRFASGVREFNLDGFRIVGRRNDLGGLDDFAGDVAAVRREYGLQRDEALWVVDGGFDVDIPAELRARFGGQPLPDYHDMDGILVAFRTPPGI